MKGSWLKRRIYISAPAWEWILAFVLIWVAIGLGLLMVNAEAADASSRYTRFEAQYTPSLHQGNPQEPVSCKAIAVHLYPEMNKGDLWFVEHEISYMNEREDVTPGQTVTVPVYQLYNSWQEVCSDLRNWHVAVCKGGKYGVNSGLLIAIRSHENPSPTRDRYAYGVVIKKHTNLWTQAEWGARIVARIAKSQGWDPLHPTIGNLYRLALVYVGQGKASARNWSHCVWTYYGRAQP